VRTTWNVCGFDADDGTGGVVGRNASKVVVIEALRDISLSLRRGDRVGLIGHNGAGKTALLFCYPGSMNPPAATLA
jgi:ABC-2 type transport system ATP-binding protein